MSIGERVKSLRARLKLTQVQLAQRLGIKQPSLSAIETGDTLELSGTVLLALARELRANPEWILYGRGNQQGSIDLTADERDLLNAWRVLGEDSRAALMQMARLLTQRPANPLLPAPDVSTEAKSVKKH